MGFNDLVLPAAVGAAIAGLGAGVAWALYSRFIVRVPPNSAAVLYGRKGALPRDDLRGAASSTQISRPRIVVGGRAFIAPWDRGVGYLSLHPVAVEVTVRSLHSLEGSRASGWEARVSVQAKIPSDPDLLAAAAENLLGKSEEEVRSLVRRSVEGAVPSVLARLRPSDLEPDWERLAAEIQATVAPDLVGSGLVVRSLSVTELVRIVPGEAPSPSAPAKPTPFAVGRAPSEGPEPAPASFEVRLSRVERSLGIIGAEIVRMVHEGPTPVDSYGSASVLDYPLGFERAESRALLGPAEVSVHDSMGGDRPPRTRPLSREGVPGEGGGARRSLLDAESER